MRIIFEIIQKSALSPFVK